MYGSGDTDLVVKYYDLTFGISGQAELDWYLSKVGSYGGPVLDLACGTGRLAIRIAQEGFEVTAIDQSEGMLEQFREKLKSQTSPVRQKVFIENQSMSDFKLAGKFRTIICCDAFYHNLSVEDEIKCLGNVATHLTADGHFVFNLPNPSCQFILDSEASKGKDFKPRGRYSLEDGSETILIEQAQAGDMENQLITTILCITRYDPDGKAIEQGISSWTTRYLFKDEAIHLLYRCGFKVESLAGDYRNGPVEKESQLIFDVRLNNPNIS